MVHERSLTLRVRALGRRVADIVALLRATDELRVGVGVFWLCVPTVSKNQTCRVSVSLLCVSATCQGSLGDVQYQTGTQNACPQAAWQGTAGPAPRRRRPRRRRGARRERRATCSVSRECVGKREWVLSTGDLVYVERHRQRPCLGGRKEDVGLTTRGEEEGIIPSPDHRVQTQTSPRS